MKFVYQTKLSGTIEAPIVPEISAFALKAAGVTPAKTNIYGLLLGDETKDALSLIKKAGVKLTRKGQGVSVSGIHDNKMAFKKIFAAELEKLQENAFELSEITTEGDTNVLLACILGDIIFGNAQTITTDEKASGSVLFAEAIRIIESLGGSVSVTGDNKVCVSNKTTLIGSEKLYVDGDWNIGAFALTAAALGYDVSVTNLYNKHSAQPAAQILKPLSQMGMLLVDEPKGKMVIANADYKRAEKIDAKLIPDVIPYMVFLATQIEGETEFYNITKDIVERNDKALLYTVAELKRLGFEVTANRSGTIGVTGRRVFDGGARINCRGNLTVSLIAVLETLCSRRSNILENCEIIEEKYPDFWEWYTNIGGFTEA